MALSAPLNAMTRNAGDGSMDVAWQAPASGQADHYDVYIAPASGGDFVPGNWGAVRGTKCKIVNLPFGATIYAKVRAVDADDNVGPWSELARDAAASKATVQLRFDGLIGDQVPSGAMFAALVNGYLVAVQVTASGEIV